LQQRTDALLLQKQLQDTSFKTKAEMLLLLLLMLLRQHGFDGGCERESCRLCEKFCKCSKFRSVFLP